MHGQGVAARKIRELRGPNIHGVSLHGELAKGVGILLRAVTHAREVFRQVIGSPGLRSGNVLRSRKYLGGVLENVSGKARINHARILDIEVGEDSPGDQKNGEDDTQNRQANDRSEKSSLNADLQTFSPLG